MDNVTINAKSGGSITNYEVDIKNSEFNFSERGIDFKNDELVAIVEAIISSGQQDQLVAVIKQIKSSESIEAAETAIKDSPLKQFFKNVKDFAPIIAALIKLGAG